MICSPPFLYLLNGGLTFFGQHVSSFLRLALDNTRDFTVYDRIKDSPVAFWFLTCGMFDLWLVGISSGQSIFPQLLKSAACDEQSVLKCYLPKTVTLLFPLGRCGGGLSTLRIRARSLTSWF